MINTKIRLILFFAAKDGETLYSQQKQDQELTVAQTMNTGTFGKQTRLGRQTVCQPMGAKTRTSIRKLPKYFPAVGKAESTRSCTTVLDLCSESKGRCVMVLTALTMSFVC